MAESGSPERVDHALRELFSGMSQPTLSPYFGRDLRRRAAAEGRRRRSLRRRRLVMRIYWLLATACSLVVVQQAAWPSTGSAAGLLAMCVVVGSFLPVLLVLRSLRTGVSDLIFGTCDRFWEIGPRP
jgi:hypothetical protein